MTAILAVADVIWEQIKSNRSVSDEQLSTLHFLFGKNFERAAKIVDEGGSRKLSGEPSHRFCFLMNLVKPIELFQKLKASPGRLLGLDVGKKYVGFAVSDTGSRIALPKSVLLRKKSNINFMAKDFQLLVSRYSLEGFVVGYPFSIHGQTSPEAMQVRLFIEDLRSTGKLDGMSYTYWNENYSSQCVDALLESLNLHPVTYKTIMDKFAAVGILQGYLDHMNRNFMSGEMPKD